MTADADIKISELDGQLALLAVPTRAYRPATHRIDAAGEHGEVFTRPWIVDLILNLVGYTSDRDLADVSVVEPACGTGAFLGSLVARLSASCQRRKRPITDTAESLRAYDLLPNNVAQSRRLVIELLIADGWPAADAKALAVRWVHAADYLLHPIKAGVADVVVGNPPYIRLEDVPEARMRAYRSACSTMTGRSDIYVGFFERALISLKPGGKVGFICADRWMRNQYGRHLRALVARNFSLDVAIAMHDVDAFEKQVSAYPAITVISRNQQQSAVVADTNATFGSDDSASLTSYVNGTTLTTLTTRNYKASRLPRWFAGDESWPTGSPARLAMIEYLTDNFRPLEDIATQTRVGIGVATGADGVYITTDKNTAEPERLLPLSMVADIASGEMKWSGHYLISPWDGNGLVNLQDYPRLSHYFHANSAALRRRHVASRQPDRWYRTIDRVITGLKDSPKLLIPDMRMTMHPVLDVGVTYPHHNLYFVTSGRWNLQVLGGLLLSRVATAFVEAYCVKMRGGTLRFQAQYLRRIRIPNLDEVSDRDSAALIDAFQHRDVNAATAISLRLYRLNNFPE
jgi:adenine-specific DNA-methyltransferase